MASFYILYSKNIDKFYIGSCLDLSERIEQHKTSFFGGYTSREDDWELYYSISNLSGFTARKIEQHVKKMKSKIYINNLRQYPEIVTNLIEKYKA